MSEPAEEVVVRVEAGGFGWTVTCDACGPVRLPMGPDLRRRRRRQKAYVAAGQSHLRTTTKDRARAVQAAGAHGAVTHPGVWTVR